MVFCRLDGVDKVLKFWCPKSLLNDDGFPPDWFVQKKVDEMYEKNLWLKIYRPLMFELE